MLSLFQRKRVPPTAGTPPTSAIEPPKGSMRPESAASLLATPRRQKLLEHIWQRTSLSRRQFATLYLAPLERYAELVQQFPASENHHHAYPGGMLDHGLEIVAYALKLRQSYLLPAGVTPEAQAAQAEAWTAGTAYAALLHDIGKMAMPLEVLNKPGKLDDDEFAIMRSHPERGHAILLNAQSSVSEAVLDVCLHHHEKVDGTGYPHRLAGEQISLLARMGAICDVYDAITSNRPYKTAWDASGSLAKMAQWQGHFDTQLLHAFVRAVGIYPLGTLVRLQSGRLGVVIEQNPQQLTAPRLKLFYSSRTRAAIPQQELDLSDARCDDRIVAREDPAAWGFGNLDELWT
ncbi:MAG TPA: phosphodiesterase [Pseudomonas sp.]|nr:phosphodiesterase [Pseudomonas sp.]